MSVPFVVQGLEDIETFHQLLEEGVSGAVNSARRLGFTKNQFLTLMRMAWHADAERERRAGER